MPVPSNRNKILPARGNYADLNSNVASLLDGEICYAIDQDQYYQKEGSVLVSVGATKAQGLLADSALQPNDNVSELLNDAGYLKNSTLQIANATDVNLDTPTKDQLLVYDGSEWVNSTAPVIVEVHNNSGATIDKGTPVYVSGTHSSGKPRIAPADNDGTGTYPAIGLVHEDLDNGDEGHVMVAGMLFGVDTATPGWSAGDALYLSSNTGVLTNIRPTVTAQKVQKVGLVTRVHATAGSILVIGAGRTNDIPNDLVTLTGVSLGDSTLGTFTGTTISDNESIKDALQTLETAVENVSVPSNVLTSTTEFGGDVSGTYNNISINDGAGSGLDADTLDGINSGSFLRSDADDSFTGTIRGISDQTNPVIEIAGDGPNIVRFLDSGNSSTLAIDLVYRTTPNTLGFEKSTDGTKLWETDCDNGVTNFHYTPTVSGNDVLTTADEGSGNGLDADTLDGIQGSSFLRSDTADTMTGALTIDVDDVASGALRIEANQTNPNNDFYFAQEIVSTLSGSTATTADREQGGIWIDVNSTATGGDTSNEHRAYGIYVDLDSSGDADNVYGIFSDATATPSTGQTSEIIGVWGRAEDNGGAGSVSNVYGVRGLAVSDNADSDSNNLYGGWFKSNPTADSGAVDIATGVWAEVEVPSGAGDILGDTYVVRSTFDNNDTNAQSNTTYLYYGAFQGTRPTTSYGVYIASDVSNYFAGDIESAGEIKISGSSPVLRFDETDNTTASRLILDGNYFYMQAGAAGSGSTTSSGDIRLTGYNGANLNSLTVRTGGSYNAIWHAGNDGAGSGLDADLLDGINSLQFLRSDADDEFSGNLTGSGTISVTGSYIEVGRTSGSVSMTVNDGYGNANIAFNHRYGIPDVNGSSARIETTVDSNTAQLLIELANNVTSGTAVGLTETLRLTTSNITYASNTVWHAGNDGSASGLDADTLDGVDSASFVRSDTNDEISSNIDFTSVTAPITTNSILFNNTENDGNYYTDATGVLAFDENFYSDTEYGTGTYDPDTVFTGGNGGGLLIKNEDGWGAIYTTQNTRWASANWDNLTIDTNQVWHAGNDGAGSGLDADTLDGQQGSYYLDYNNFTNTPSISSGAFDDLTGKTSGTGEYSTSGTLTAGRGSGGVSLTVNDGYGNANVTFNHKDGTPEQNGNAARIEVNTDSTSGASIYFEAKSNVTASTAVSLTSLFTMNESGAICLGNTVWHAGNDGSGSGLDADTLDGINSGSFLRSNAADTFSGDLTSSGSARIIIKKTDNNVSDHIQFWNGGTRIGEIGCEDGTWLRINQETAKNIFTPRYIRADGGFFVDGTSKGINGSGNFIGGTIAGASDYGTLIRSNADDNVTGHTEWQDNYEIRLGNGADFRMEHNGTNTIFRNYKHTDGDVLFQGENSAGTNQNILKLDTSGTRTYCILYENNAERLRTINGGVDISGNLSGMSNVTLTGQLNLVGSTNANKYIDARTGDGNSLHLRLASGGDSNHEQGIVMTRGGGVKLYYNNVMKFETTSIGANCPDTFTATTKFFDINHPTKEGMRLRHGCLEGPENGVYLRGRLQGTSIIELPDYWTGLVHEDTITVNLTPIGINSTLHKVIDISNNTVTIAAEDGNVNCFYMVFAERKDVDKLEAEYTPE